jgi:hypothetical protein
MEAELSSRDTLKHKETNLILRAKQTTVIELSIPSPQKNSDKQDTGLIFDGRKIYTLSG